MLDLTPFQAQDLDWIKQHNKYMLLWDGGIGKTYITTKRNVDLGVGTALVTGPARAWNAWKTHTIDPEKSWWLQDKPTHDIDIFYINGDPAVRKRIWDELLHCERTNQHRLFFCTHDTFIRDHQHLSKQHIQHIDQIDLDEAHRMRNRQSVSFKHYHTFLRNHNHFSFLTGTPIGVGQEQFWTFLNCINPKEFSSYWRFANTFSEIIDGRYGKEIIGPRNTEAFFHLMLRFSRIRKVTDPDVAPYMPKSKREALFTQLSPAQEKIYHDLDTKKWSIREDPTDGIILAGGSLEQRLRFRQLLVCPKILDPNAKDMGGAFNDFLEGLGPPNSDDGHTVLFTPFKTAFPFFKQSLERAKYHVNQLHGGISPEEQTKQIQEWKSAKGIMLCTITYAESFTLHAKSSYFIGYEYNQNANKQAEWRLSRLDTTTPVTNYYFRYEGTIDDEVCNRVNFRNSNVDGFFQGIQDYQNRLSILQG